MIQFDQVTKRYDQGPVVVDHLDLSVKPGELVTLIGSSGCGKTTTLKMVNRLIEMSSGQIRVNGRDIQKQDVIQLRRGIGYVIQQIGLFPNMTIGENITVVCRLLGWAKPRLQERSEELLRLVDMEPEIYLHRYPRELSGGQQQRIGVLRALAAEPEIILMDEPFGALDPITREQLQNELKNLQMKLHKTILFVTHDMNEALKLSDHIVLMRQGQIVQMGTPEDLLRRPANEFVVNFIGKDRMLLSPDEVTIADVMLRDPVTTEPGSRLAEALEKMHSKRVDSLMVVDDKKRLLGVVRIQAIQSGFSKVNRVGDLKLQQPVVIEAGRSVREAVQLMSQKEVGFLPVIDDAGRLQGLITRSSLVNILSDVLWAGSGNTGNDSDTSSDEEAKRGDLPC